MRSPIRLIDADTVRALLPIRKCVEIMRHAFSLVSGGQAVQPIRQTLRQPDGQGLLSIMPGWIGDPPSLGIKVSSVFMKNFGTPLGSHQGFVILFDPVTGSPKALLDGGEITAIRTAAATAVATDTLARPDARTLGIFGYGQQAATHLEALRLVRPFERVMVWGRDPDKARRFCEQHSDAELMLEWADTPDIVAATMDVLCLVTASPEPYFKASFLRHGQHLNVAGSSRPDSSEIDSATVAASRVFVDFEPSALALGGDLRRAIADGSIEDTHIVGSVGDVLTGKIEGRRNAAEVTLFKSLGMIAEDLVAANYVLEQSILQGDVGMTW